MGALKVTYICHIFFVRVGLNIIFFFIDVFLQHHVKMHESKKELADIECIICQWREKVNILLM